MGPLVLGAMSERYQPLGRSSGMAIASMESPRERLSWMERRNGPKGEGKESLLHGGGQRERERSSTANYKLGKADQVSVCLRGTQENEVTLFAIGWSAPSWPPGSTNGMSDFLCCPTISQCLAFYSLIVLLPHGSAEWV